jgi:hypothetical protein
MMQAWRTWWEWRALAFLVVVLASVIHGCGVEKIQEVGPVYLPLTVRRAGDHYFADNTATSAGNGTFATPWRSISEAVKHLGPGDTLHIRGDKDGPRIYNGGIIVAASGTGTKPITIRPYSGEHVELRASAGVRILYITGDYVVVDGQGRMALNKNEQTGQAARLSGDHNTLRGLEIKNVVWAGTMVLLEGDGNVVDKCEIHDCFSGNSRDCNGVRIEGGADNVVQHSVISNVRGDCVNIDDRIGTEHGTIIHANHLYTELGKCSENAIDIKANLASGRPLVITDNVIHGFRACPGTCGGSGDPHGEGISVHNVADNAVIQGNLIYDCTTGIGIDDYVSGFDIQDNTIRNLAKSDPNAGIYAALFVRAKNVDISGNVVQNVPRSFAFVSPVSNTYIHHNTFEDSGGVYGRGVSGWRADYNCWRGSGTVLAGAHDGCE